MVHESFRAAMRALPLAALVLLAVAGSASASMITNSGFDTGTSGWTPVGNDGAGGWQAGAGSGGPGGNPGGYFLLNAGGACASDPTISQTVTGLTIGNHYRITFDYASRWMSFGNANAASFGLFLDNTLLFEDVRKPNTDWVTQQVSFYATSTSHTILFAGERNCIDQSWGIDNVVMDDITPAQPVPELGTVLLVAAGAGLVGVAVLRRR